MEQNVKWRFRTLSYRYFCYFWHKPLKPPLSGSRPFFLGEQMVPCSVKFVWCCHNGPKCFWSLNGDYLWCKASWQVEAASWRNSEWMCSCHRWATFSLSCRRIRVWQQLPSHFKNHRKTVYQGLRLPVHCNLCSSLADMAQFLNFFYKGHVSKEFVISAMWVGSSICWPIYSSSLRFKFVDPRQNKLF